MGSEIGYRRAETAPAVALAPCSVLVISRDPVERQDVVLTLSAVEQVDAASAAGFHMAVPMIWSGSPDVIVIGTLTPTDARRLGELRQHAPCAKLVRLASARDEYGEARADAQVPAGGDLLTALRQLVPAPQ